eukprot:4608485-Prymnesium_polylepis.2
MADARARAAAADDAASSERSPATSKLSWAQRSRFVTAAVLVSALVLVTHCSGLREGMTARAAGVRVAR